MATETACFVTSSRPAAPYISTAAAAAAAVPSRDLAPFTLAAPTANCCSNGAAGGNYVVNGNGNGLILYPATANSASGCDTTATPSVHSLAYLSAAGIAMNPAPATHTQLNRPASCNNILSNNGNGHVASCVNIVKSGSESCDGGKTTSVQTKSNGSNRLNNITDDYPPAPILTVKCNNGYLDDLQEASTEAPASPRRRPTLWYEEEIDDSLRWCFGLISILHTGVSKYQEIALLDTQPFGKVLTLDRKMQSAEIDEWVYHECLVHPALLHHQSPKTVFIMGGGEGSTAREILRHKSIRKVVMCDIDEEVVKFCSTHLTVNYDAFRSSRLELVINDARAELVSRHGEQFDVIIGDLADPLECGPCYQLYSKVFYETVVKPRLSLGGIFVTQAGPAGVLSHKEVFTSIFNTLKQVFAYVVAYSAHVPSYADTWGWVMASDKPFDQVPATEIDMRIRKHVIGELRYLDGKTMHASTMLNKVVRQSLANEKHVYTEDSARFIYGHGQNKRGH